MSCDCTSKNNVYCIHMHWNEHRMPYHQQVGWNFPFVVCRLNTTDNKKVDALYGNIGDKRYWNGYTFLRIQFAFEMELISFFIKFIIISGLVMVCSVWLGYFLITTHLFFWFLVVKEYKCTTADTESVWERRCFFLFFYLFKYMLVNSHLTPPTPTLWDNYLNSRMFKSSNP